MNARTVNISSLVILLALLSLICEGFLYYFLPSPIWSIVFAVLVSLALSHFFLESSFSYSYNVLHAAFMTIGAFIYAVIVYCIQPNPWLHYSFYLVLLVLVNWLTPFLYCSIRDLYEKTGYVIDTHTAVAASVYHKYKKDTNDAETKTVIASTASPFKFSRSVMDAIDPKYDSLSEFELVDELSKIGNVKIPQAIEEIRSAEVRHKTVCEVEEMPKVVKQFLGM